MDVPDKFPPGCDFAMDLTDDDGVELSYVEFPDGRRFVLDEKSPWSGMSPTTWWPLRWSRLTEADFLAIAGKSSDVVSAAHAAAAPDVEK
jgi:hypothetical protein